MILSAGLGTRLRPLTEALPKPLVWIGDMPAILHVLSSVASLHAKTTVINSFYNASKLSEFVRLSAPHCVVSEEEKLLGTAGGIAHAIERGLLSAEGDLLVWNGDIISELPTREFVAAHTIERPFATLAVRRRAAGEGNVGFTEDGRVVRLRQVTHGAGAEDHGGDFLGISVLSPACLSALPPEGCLVGDVWIPAIARGERIHVYCTDAHTDDIGSVESYAAANFHWLDRLQQGRSYAAIDAEVSHPKHSIVGAGAKIRGFVRDSIIWPGVVADGPLDSVIAGPGFRVRIPRRW